MMKLCSLMAVVLAFLMLFASVGVVSAEGGKVEVVIWHTFTNLQDEALNAIADDFNAGQDAITIVVQPQPYQGFEDNVFSAVANGVGPNIIFNYPSTAANYVDSGKVADLGQYIDDAEIGIPGYKESLPEAIYAEADSYTDGKIHSMPMVTTGPILFYNATLYEELGLSVPATWTELAENAKVIYEAKGIPGFAADSLTDITQSMMMQAGSGYIDTESKTILFNNEKTAERIQWFADNVQAGYFSITPAGDYWSNDFSAGLVACYLGSSAGVPYITPDGFEYAVAPMPQEGDVKWAPAWNRAVIVFSADEAVERAAYEFAKFFVSPENNARWCEAMVALSPYAGTKEVEAYQAFIAANPALAAVEANLPYAGMLPSVPGAYEVREALKKAVTMAASGTMTAEEALSEAELTANEALQG